MTLKGLLTVEEMLILLYARKRAFMQGNRRTWSAPLSQSLNVSNVAISVKVLLVCLSRGEQASQQKEMIVDYLESTKLIRNRQLRSSKRNGTSMLKYN